MHSLVQIVVISGLDGTITTVAYLTLHVLEVQHVIFAASGQMTYGSLLKIEEFTQRDICHEEEKIQQD